MNQPHINIMGTRGIPAAHGGFETFAESLALYLVSQGWSVSVYCQSDGIVSGEPQESEWHGVQLITFGTTRQGAAGTMEFDFKCVRDVIKRPGVDLVLGYNTAIFNLLQRLCGRRIFMNMDGIEWKRAKWSLLAKIWFFINEVIGANICSVPIADHPEIARHVARRSLHKPVTIPYGSDRLGDLPTAPLKALGLEPDGYFISIARIEPENSILEIVRSFSAKPRGLKLVVLGNFKSDNDYHQAVRSAASEEVIFPGAIYEVNTVRAARKYARGYIHGHQVGGTNPSLVEALGAGNAIIAHNNKFNRWVAGDSQMYFGSAKELEFAIETVISDGTRVQAMRKSAQSRHGEGFELESILAQYRDLLLH